MRRRDFIALVGGAAGFSPLTARAQRSGKVPTIGFLGVVSPAGWSTWLAAFLQRLRELGWTDGRNIAIEYRWTEGRNDRLPEIAGEFARLKVDIVVTAGVPAVVAVRQAMPTTPIVFAIVGDPVGTGLVSSLGRPGGNVTGLSMVLPDATGKRLELLRELIPNMRRLAVMANAGFADSLRDMSEVRAVARKLDLEIDMLEIRRSEDIAPAFERLQGRSQAIYVSPDPLVLANVVRINTLAQGARLPTMYGMREYVDAGGLLSFGPNIADNFRRSADFVDRILRGSKPADLPVEQPTKFDFVINLNTAKALGMKIPETMLLRADRLIE